MDCLVINQNKIKITLTSSELKKYGLDVIAGFDTKAENINYNKPVYTYSQENIKMNFMQSILIKINFPNSSLEKLDHCHAIMHNYNS